MKKKLIKKEAPAFLEEKEIDFEMLRWAEKNRHVCQNTVLNPEKNAMQCTECGALIGIRTIKTKF